MILPPKQPPEEQEKNPQVKFRWPPELVEEIKALAKRADRSMNEAGEMLMRWAVERAKAEWELMGGPSEGRRKK